MIGLTKGNTGASAQGAQEIHAGGTLFTIAKIALYVRIGKIRFNTENQAFHLMVVADLTTD